MFSFLVLCITSLGLIGHMSVLTVWNRTVAPMARERESRSELRVLHSMLFRARQELSDAAVGHSRRVSLCCYPHIREFRDVSSYLKGRSKMILSRGETWKAPEVGTRKDEAYVRPQEWQQQRGDDRGPSARTCL